MSLELRERNDMIVRLVDRGGLSLSEVARDFGITRERARQIYHETKERRRKEKRK